MKKEMLWSLLKVSLAALTTAFAVSSHAADKLVVATDTAFVPFGNLTRATKYVGFDVDLWGRYRERTETDTHKPMDFSGIIPALQSQKYRSGAGGYYDYGRA